MIDELGSESGGEDVEKLTNSQPVSDGVDGIRTTRMLERAARQRWPIPEKYKEAIIKRQVVIAISSTSKPREASAAARTLLNADKINIEQQKLEQPEQHLHLHQAVPNQAQIDLSKLSRQELEALERMMIVAQPESQSQPPQSAV